MPIHKQLARAVFKRIGLEVLKYYIERLRLRPSEILWKIPGFGKPKKV